MNRFIRSFFINFSVDLFIINNSIYVNSFFLLLFSQLFSVPLNTFCRHSFSVNYIIQMLCCSDFHAVSYFKVYYCLGFQMLIWSFILLLQFCFQVNCDIKQPYLSSESLNSDKKTRKNLSSENNYNFYLITLFVLPLFPFSFSFQYEFQKIKFSKPFHCSFFFPSLFSQQSNRRQ